MPAELLAMAWRWPIPALAFEGRMHRVVQNLRDSQDSHDLAFLVAYLDTRLRQGGPIIHILFYQISSASFRFVQRFLEGWKFSAFFVPDHASGVAQIDEI